MLRAWDDGIRRQNLELLLPNAAADGGWPGGIRQQFRAAQPLVEALLRQLKTEQRLEGRVTPEWLDESDCVAAWQSERLAAVLFPTADSLPALQRVDDALSGQRLTMLVNAQWQTQGQVISGARGRLAEAWLVGMRSSVAGGLPFLLELPPLAWHQRPHSQPIASRRPRSRNMHTLTHAHPPLPPCPCPSPPAADFGFGKSRKQAERFVASFDDVYYLRRVRVFGDDIRVLRCYPGQWQVHYVTPGREVLLLGCEDERPTYERLMQLLKAVQGSRCAGASLVPFPGPGLGGSVGLPSGQEHQMVFSLCVGLRLLHARPLRPAFRPAGSARAGWTG